MKVGDKVKVLKKVGGNWNAGTMDQTVGEAGTIIEVNDEPQYLVQFDNDKLNCSWQKGWWYYKEALALISTAPDDLTVANNALEDV